MQYLTFVLIVIEKTIRILFFLIIKLLPGFLPLSILEILWIILEVAILPLVHFSTQLSYQSDIKYSQINSGRMNIIF